MASSKEPITLRTPMTRFPSLPAGALAVTLSIAACTSPGASAVATAPAATGSASSSVAAPTAAASAATATGKVNANTASQADLQAAFEAAGISNAAKWAKEVAEYRPYAADPTWATLRQELSKYNIDPAVFAQIIAVLQV
jgi:DNA uptake protein ComE-like DNA-binding protein